MKLKLLLIAPTCNEKDVGEAWVAYQWVKHLSRRHDVTLLTYHKRGAVPASQQCNGLRVIEWVEPAIFGYAERLNSIMKPAYFPFYWKAKQWIKSAIARGERFDLAHQPVPVAMRYPSPVTGCGIPYIIGPVGGGLSTPPGFASDEGGTPLYMKLRAVDSLRRRRDPWLRKTYSQAACVLGIAPYVREELADIPLQRFEIMSETGLESVPAPIDRAGRSGPIRLLYVGRLVRTKGVRDILRSLAQLPDLDIHLDIVGEGPERPVCESLLSEFELSQKVTLHGWKNKAEVMQFYRDADVFVFPSYREPGGNVALEAMAHSLPLIVVDRGGPGSAVTDACAIKLTISTPDDLAQKLAAAISNLASDPALRRKMGIEAYAHVRQTALWSAKIDQFDRLCSELAQLRQH